MAFEATKREWCELYTFFRLLTEGKVTLGTAKAKKGEIDWPIAMIQREEHDGTRCYYIEKEMVRIKGENSEKSVPDHPENTPVQEPCQISCEYGSAVFFSIYGYSMLLKRQTAEQCLLPI